MSAGWATGIAAFATFLLALPLAVRLFGGNRGLVAVVVGTAGVNFAAWCIFFPPPLDRTNVWGFVAVYGFLFIAFLQAFAIIYKSISLRMLVEIADLPGESLAVGAVHNSLIVSGAYARRLEGLELGGFVSRSGPAIELTEKGRRTARWIEAIQRTFGVVNSG